MRVHLNVDVVHVGIHRVFDRLRERNIRNIARLMTRTRVGIRVTRRTRVGFRVTRRTRDRAGMQAYMGCGLAQQ